MLSSLACTQPALCPALCAGLGRGELGGWGRGTKESKENKEGSGQGCRGGRGTGERDGGMEQGKIEQRRIREGIQRGRMKEKRIHPGCPRAVTPHQSGTWGSTAVTCRYNSTQFNLMQNTSHNTYGMSLASSQWDQLVEEAVFLGSISGFLS